MVANWFVLLWDYTLTKLTLLEIVDIFINKEKNSDKNAENLSADCLYSMAVRKEFHCA